MLSACRPEIRLTGRVAVETCHERRGELLFTARQPRLAFAVLVLERHRPVGRDELAETLWPHGLPSAAFADGTITLAQLRTGTDKLRARLTDIEDTLTAAATINPLIGLAGQPNVAEIWYGTTPDHSGGLDLDRRRAVFTKLLTVTVLPTGRGRLWHGG